MNAPFNGIDSETRGRLRTFRKKLEADYAGIARFTAAMRSETISDFMMKKGKGRRRVFNRIDRELRRHGARLVVARLEGKQPLAMWSVLEPRRAVWADTADHSRDQQDVVCLNYWMVGWSPDMPRGALLEAVWTLELTEHCLGRCLQRSRNSDPVAIIYAIHNALLHVGDQLRMSFRLRVGEHVLMCEAHGESTEGEKELTHLHIRVRTYLDFDALSPRQEAELVEANGTPAVWLWPHPFREISMQDDGALAVTFDGTLFAGGILPAHHHQQEKRDNDE